MINLAVDVHIAAVAKQMDTEDLAEVLNAFAPSQYSPLELKEIAQCLSLDGCKFVKSLAEAADAANDDDEWEGEL